MHTRLIDHITQYTSLNETEQQLFMDALEFKQLRKDEYLLREGDICKRDHFVIKGGMRQYEITPDGKEHIIHFGFEDWWITDRYSLITQTPSLYHIQALEVTELLQIDMPTLEALFGKAPRVEKYFHMVLQQAFAAWQGRIRTLQKSAEERYHAFLADYGHIEQRLSQQHIASYLGITRETLSRIRASKGK